MIFYSRKKHPFSPQIIHTGDSCRRVKMRDFCHGISSADLLYNGFSDDASCCPATCSVSREPCHSAQIHGSFTCSQRFENKHTPINQSGTNGTRLQQRRRLGPNCLPTREAHTSKVGTKSTGSASVHSTVQLEHRPVSAAAHVTVIKWLSSAVLARPWKMKLLVVQGKDRCRTDKAGGHMKPRDSSTVASTKQSILIRARDMPHL